MKVGEDVRVVTIIPQYYTDSTEWHQRAEMAYVGQYLDRVGTLVMVDGDKKHPYVVAFYQECGHCGTVVPQDQTMRFSEKEIERYTPQPQDSN